MPYRCKAFRLPVALTLPLVGALLGGLLTVPATAQGTIDTTGTATDLEGLLEAQEDTGDATQLVERLALLREQRLDVNAADDGELAQIPAFGPLLARAVVRYRDEAGPFETLEDLRAVEGLSDDILQAARPYLTIGAAAVSGAASRVQPSSSRRPVRRLRIELLQRTERRLDVGRGYNVETGPGFAGSPERLYTRLRVLPGERLSLNLTLEKDPGERFAWDPASHTYGFDHLTAHAALRKVGRLHILVVGDYVAEFGQGLVLWRSTSFGKGRETVRQVSRAGQGIVPYASTEENAFLRGLAATLRLGPDLYVSLFSSRRTLDAGLEEADTTAAPDAGRAAATSFGRTGLHRTPTEIARKDAVRESLTGGNVTYRIGAARIGVVGYHSRFDHPILPGNKPYQRFDFAGDRATMAGLYTDVFFGSAHLFGELARSPDGVPGALGGVLLPLSAGTRALILVRHYPRDFASLHGNAFSERSGSIRNESGYYVGLDLRPGPRWRLSAYFDHYRFPWMRFGMPRPGSGFDMLLLVEHRPRRWLTVYLQGRSESAESGTVWNGERGRRLDALRLETRQSLRLHGDYRFGARLGLRARIEGVRFAARGEPVRYGVVVYQEAGWQITARLHLDVRLAFFDTDSFAARVATYEQDLRNTLSVPALSGRGRRAYALLRWRVSDRLSLEGKAAVTHYEDVRTLGSGLGEVAGNRVREVRAQLQWRL